MSWSISLFGKAAKVAEAIENHPNDKMTGQSGSEWQAAKPHLLALVKANFITDEYKKMYLSAQDLLVKLDANGSATVKHPDNTPLSGSCFVKLETYYTNCV